MVKKIKLTIPKIEIGIEIITDNKDNNKDKEVKKSTKIKKDNDFYFVKLHELYKTNSVTLLTLRDCLTIPIYSLCYISKKSVTKSVLFGYDDLIPSSMIVFGDKNFSKVKDTILDKYYTIKNDLEKYAKSLFTSYVIDIVSLKTKKIKMSIDLRTGRWKRKVEE